jgi:hypothetical protein
LKPPDRAGNESRGQIITPMAARTHEPLTKTLEEIWMKKISVCFLLILPLLGLCAPPSALAQRRSDERGYGRIIRRDKNGVRVGDGRITVFDGPGIVNYEHRHRWMEGPRGAATVIGIGAGAGAVTGGVVKGKKGAVIGALVGGGAATGLWLYKNRRHKHRIF